MACTMLTSGPDPQRSQAGTGRKCGAEKPARSIGPRIGAINTCLTDISQGDSSPARGEIFVYRETDTDFPLYVART